MANQYFVFKKQPEIGEDFTIDDKAAVHHIFTVMRTSVGEKIQLPLKTKEQHLKMRRQQKKMRELHLNQMKVLMEPPSRKKNFRLHRV